MSEKPILVLVGSANDIQRVAASVDPDAVAIALVNESTPDKEIPKLADVIVYVMNRYSYSSSQLYGQFVHVDYLVKTSEAFMLFLDGATLPEGVFPSMPKLPTIRIEDLADAVMEAHRPG